MVYINQVGFENFKSFGGNIEIPLEEGFTVVTGPNGSGKSNILDGILFCLGLASSRGMRAERLPDLINNSKVKEGKASETSVTVKFNLKDWSPRDNQEDYELEEDEISLNSNQKEWIVSRKLRLMPGGSYASTYTSDGKVCTLQQIQKVLRDIRVDPEGSNVVMQGDVTRIVSMSNKERRTLIDELAGVALFDNRIEQTHSKLSDVYERQERCEILQNELESSKLRLEKECEKAKKYKELKNQLNQLKEIEKVLLYNEQIKRIESIDKKKLEIEQNKSEHNQNILDIQKEVEKLEEELKEIVSELKDKGEDKLIKVNSDIGSIHTNLRELDRLSSLNKLEGNKLKENRDQIAIAKRNIEKEKNAIKNFDFTRLESLQENIKEISSTHKLSRKKLSEAAGESGKYSKQNLVLNNKIEQLKSLSNPLNTQKRIIEEEIIQYKIQKDEISSQINLLALEIENIADKNNNNKIKLLKTNENLENVKLDMEMIQKEIDILNKTKLRLSDEQSKLEKDLTRHESRKEAINETRGSFALRILLEAGLEGIHGYVAQLGEVNEKHRYALEIAAGNRLGQIVVDNDIVASKAIDILKKKKAGRLTFLPLNRIKKNKYNQSLSRFENVNENGFIDKAINLIHFDEIYSDVFKYVFGETLVFSDLESAKCSKQKNRLVTIGGELLEMSGAITGGSKTNRDLAYRFGLNKETDETTPLKQRLLVLKDALSKSNEEIQGKTVSCEALSMKQRSINEDIASINKEIDLNNNSLESLKEKNKNISDRSKKLDKSINELNDKLNQLDNQLFPLQRELSKLQLSLKENYENNQQSKLVSINQDFENLDNELAQLVKERDILLDQKNQFALTEERIKNDQKLLQLKEKNLEESVIELAKAHHEWKEKRDSMNQKICTLEEKKKLLENDLGFLRRKRDELNSNISNKRQKHNEISVKLEYLERDIVSLVEERRNEINKLQNYKNELPDPLPSLGEFESNGIEILQARILSINSKLESLEPVNMLALEELEDLSQRLNELIEKLNVLSNERSELLLRIETVSTMRQEAFMEAFSEVDKHFREIFAMLSDGDGFLQLENLDSPLDGGLTLVAHPKGKNVRRLASMSGGEKSLTALSFLFALQKYKPSPFYALDEVDSFLDGVNVERLSKLIASQSANAQFLVVSHRRPMIGASMRTIGVAQARGANTQVVGLPNAA